MRSLFRHEPAAARLIQPHNRTCTLPRRLRSLFNRVPLPKKDYVLTTTNPPAESPAAGASKSPSPRRSPASQQPVQTPQPLSLPLVASPHPYHAPMSQPILTMPPQPVFVSPPQNQPFVAAPMPQPVLISSPVSVLSPRHPLIPSPHRPTTPPQSSHNPTTTTTATTTQQTLQPQPQSPIPKEWQHDRYRCRGHSTV